ncbi:nickel-dependent lactate racemase [Anaerospora hongkongensis]|uniref:Nickel-dependent lactate racemase n=1 Tax=Anaerospora hongkongensis TaxID=244830 RepID=A0A4R1Q803_9FIRM|nr:nickel-dependent lactate racemase [Anaerospora hongkongensis]TCL38289.1 nickel-dependent lactate racemase [Anaerospora hongkongensis]
MKKVKLAYGKTGIEVTVPDQAVVIEPRHLAALPDEKAAVTAALRQPVGTLPLKEMVQQNQKVVIVISDITRPTPNHKLVPWLLEELAHVPSDNITILNGLGSHRANTQDELVQMLGRKVVDTIRIINHDAFTKEQLVKVGVNSHGSNVYFHKEYVNADFKIVTGFIEPHFFAGFSGGPKGICPGVAGIETILDFHNAKMVGHPLSTWGIIDGNILQGAATENCLMAKPDFMLNVTLNGDKAITGVFAGDVIAAHRQGCSFVKEHAMYEVDAPFDIVITTNSGYPLDQNLYQTVKGMSAAAQVVKPKGAIIAVSECSDGLPNHGNYAKILKMRETPQELLDMINDESFSMFDQWEAQVQAMIQLKADCYLYSSIDEETIRQAKLTPIKDVESTLQQLMNQYGENTRIAILPLGPLTIPYVK